MSPCQQVKVKKSDNDLLIEQLKETLRVLAADKIPTSKLEKRLEDVAHKWDEAKKLQPQVKSSVEPIQVRAADAAACYDTLAPVQCVLALQLIVFAHACSWMQHTCNLSTFLLKSLGSLLVWVGAANMLPCHLPLCCPPCSQRTQAQRIRKDIEAFTARVGQYKTAFHSNSLYKFATGCEAAYGQLNTAAAELAKLRKECSQCAELASIFELTDAMGPVTAALKELHEDLVAVKDVWDCTMLCETQFQVWQKAAETW